MTAILVLQGSKYDCNLSFAGVHIWLQSWFCKGPFMTAILVLFRSKYDCNPDNKGVQIWLQSYLLGNKYDCNNWNVHFDEIRPEMRVRNAQRDFRDCTHICSLTDMIAVIFGPLCYQDCSHIWTSTKPRLQSYMDPSKTKIAVIFGPQQNQDCTHIWTFVKPRLQSYVDLNKTKIAVLFGPQHFGYCTHNRTPPI